MGRLKKHGKPTIRPFETPKEELRFLHRLERRYPTDDLIELRAHAAFFNEGILKAARILRRVWKKRQAEAGQ